MVFLQLSLLLVACRYHLVRPFDESWGREIDVGTVKLRSFLPVAYFAAIDASNGGVAVFFNMTSFQTSMARGGRGRREGCVEIDSSDPRDDV